MASTDDLQRQIVELRQVLDQQGATHAAMIDHLVRREVAAAMSERLPTKEVTAWATSECVRAAARKRDIRDTLLKWVQFSSYAVIGFVALAIFEAIRAAILGRKP